MPEISRCIIVDSRELKRIVPDELEKLKIPIEYKQLEVADYLIGNIAIERKEINDYLASMMDGRLSNQLYNQSRCYPISYVIVEGFASQALINRENITKEMYISSLIGDSMKKAPEGERGQIITINVETPYETALALRSIYEKVYNGNEFRTPHFGTKAKTTNEAMVMLLTAIPGVGDKKAIALLKQHKNMKALIGLTPKELQEAEGIGPKLAQNIYDVLNNTYKIED